MYEKKYTKKIKIYKKSIINKINKRKEKYSGDTEVFKERRNDRHERQIESARKRGLPTENDALDDEEPVPESKVSAEDNDYYDYIANKTARKREGKKEEYESAKASARAYLLGTMTEELDESGKRLITRQIEKRISDSFRFTGERRF